MASSTLPTVDLSVISATQTITTTERNSQKNDQQTSSITSADLCSTVSGLSLSSTISSSTTEATTISPTPLTTTTALSDARGDTNTFVFVPQRDGLVVVDSNASSLSSSTSDYVSVKDGGLSSVGGGGGVSASSSYNNDLSTAASAQSTSGSQQNKSRDNHPSQLTNICQNQPAHSLDIHENQGEQLPSSPSAVGALDRDWKIRYRQFLACMMSEPVLIEYFENTFDVLTAVERYKVEFEFKQIQSP